MPTDEAWHLDKRVPIALIVALMLNSAFGVWYASKLDSRVTIIEIQEAKLESIVTSIEQRNSDASGRMVHVEDKINEIAEWVHDQKEAAISGQRRPPNP